MNETNTTEPNPEETDTEEPTMEESTTEEAIMEETITEEPETEQPKMLASDMKELIAYIARAIVNSPDDVEITEETDDEGIMLKLQVADEDKGRVIGKQGRIVQAMRTLLRVKAAKQGTRASLEII